MLHGPQQERSSKRDNHCIQMVLLRVLSCGILETSKDEDSSNCSSAWWALGGPRGWAGLYSSHPAQAARCWAKITTNGEVCPELVPKLVFQSQELVFQRWTDIPKDTNHRPTRADRQKELRDRVNPVTKPYQLARTLASSSQPRVCGLNPLLEGGCSSLLSQKLCMSSSKAFCLLLSTLAQWFLFSNLQSKPS